MNNLEGSRGRDLSTSSSRPTRLWRPSAAPPGGAVAYGPKAVHGSFRSICGTATACPFGHRQQFSTSWRAAGHRCCSEVGEDLLHGPTMDPHQDGDSDAWSPMGGCGNVIRQASSARDASAMSLERCSGETAWIESEVGSQRNSVGQRIRRAENGPNRRR
jgi:hypothetical protein